MAAVILTSCNKQEDLGAPQDTSKAEFFFNDVNNVTDEACSTSDIETLKSSDGIAAGCFTITSDTMSFPHTVIIDFGSANCLCADGRNRRGVINVSFTGRYRDAGTVITITTSNYFVNDNQIIGTHTITHMGLNANDHPYYGVVVSGEIILADGSGTITWNITRTREWIQGSSTPEFSDDIYSIIGGGAGTSAGGAGTSAGGAEINVQITAPLIRKLEPGCRMHFVSGIVEVTPGTLATRTLDFGNGDCDNIATVTANGNTYTITLN